MDIPDHLLEQIFLRLPDLADLARASAACVSFRRLAIDGSFPRRFCRLHAPLLLGFLDPDGYHPALPPNHSAPAACALTLAADFSFAFLPSHCRWTVQDVRDGRVLLNRGPREDERSPVFRELAVCDPLHRRYVLLPPVPHDLAASLEHSFPMARDVRCKPFLIPLGVEEAAAGETTFRVILMAQCETSLSAFIFSSSTGQWQTIASKDLSDLGLDRFESITMSHGPISCQRRHYAYGRFYWDWAVISINKLLVFDTMRMEFSVADLPPGDWTGQGLVFVEAGEGRLGMFGFDGEFASHLSYTIAQNESGSPSQWQVEKSISLDSRYKYLIRDATQKYLLFTRRKTSPLEKLLFEYFSLDVKTMQLQMVCAKQCTLHTLIYTNFPPSLLSLPTI
ncbi:hypothetical protein CFC21_111511 [Triticum aestivum]|uniref:F-box domain-containing protein n=2 Tax=Triticum aestivum TaxID=4565 RepID=A0A9R1NF60_WHEAT|nr:uncharacterized protein LOC123166501 [Triticum aestivum]KAF7111505.1 hypothetical protein CFC21_111511 [Triticum aestivum]